MSDTKEPETIPITVEFTCVFVLSAFGKILTHRSGGLEMLFANQRKYELKIPVKDESGAPTNIAFLVRYLCQNIMKDPRKELFVLDDSV
jgi:ubiquitin related modifier 1